MKRALVCGAGGFIGCHLVKKLKREGYWVRAVDIKQHEWTPKAGADEFLQLDLRIKENCEQALTLPDGKFDEVYQLAADMGGMGFIHSAETEIMYNSALINLYMVRTAADMKIPRYFFSSSVCVYRDMQPGEPEMTEAQAIPAHPDNEYGWEKLYSERLAEAYERNTGQTVRVTNGRESLPLYPKDENRISVRGTGSYGFSNNVTGNAALGYLQTHNVQQDIMRRSITVELRAQFTF